MIYPDNGFSRSDAEDAKEAYNLWQGRKAENVDEYTMRRRKAELYALVRKVIKEELTEEQQELVRLQWYEGKSINEMALEMNMNRSVIYKKMKRINEIIYDKLKYAMEYRYGKSFSDDAAVIIRTNCVACFPVEGKSISERLRQMRVINSLSESDVADVTGISKKRLSIIEDAGEKMTIEELKKLVKLFSTTSDYIIFGKNNCPKGVVR